MYFWIKKTPNERNIYNLLVNEEQTQRLTKMFQYLDGENKGFIKLDDFKNIYEIQLHAFRYFIS